MHISLIQYGQMAWRAAVSSPHWTNQEEGPLWEKDNFPTAEAGLSEAQAILSWLAMHEIPS
jgi:hypothetical protein